MITNAKMMKKMRCFAVNANIWSATTNNPSSPRSPLSLFSKGWNDREPFVCVLAVSYVIWSRIEQNKEVKNNNACHSCAVCHNIQQFPTSYNASITYEYKYRK